MAFSLRLSPHLEAEARKRAESLGVPLNALVAVALDFYLRDADSFLSPRASAVHDFLEGATVVYFPASSAAATAPATGEDVGRGGAGSTPPRGKHGETSGES